MILEGAGALPAPRSALSGLADAPHPFLLESAAPGPRFGRFSFAGASPFLTISARGSRIEVRRGDLRERWEGDPFGALRELARTCRREAADLPTPLPFGAVGFLSYDLVRSIERLPALAKDDLGLPDLWFGFYDTVATWDHVTGDSRVASLRGPGAARDLVDRLRAAEPGPLPVVERGGPLESNFTRAEYVSAVAAARDLIAAGDVLQVNLSQRFSTERAEPGPDLYRRLVEANPAPFAAYLRGPDGMEVLSASPERFLRVSGDRVEAFPVKGTRPRAAGPEADRRLAAELLESEKDRAELAMIVDLLRSDLGRVSRFGSVEVSGFPTLTTHPTVHHLHARVGARLERGRDVFDLLRSAFPCGSITGAPKVRAMEIIEELEPFRRGVYTGALGYLSFTGETDLCVAIRTLVKRGDRVTFSVGGGIVADSDPDAEFDETLHKGRGLAAALGREL